MSSSIRRGKTRAPFAEPHLSALATKADLSELRAATKADLSEFRAATKADLSELRAATEADISGLRASAKTDLTTEIGRLELKIESAKTDETRQRRITKAIEQLGG